MIHVPYRRLSPPLTRSDYYVVSRYRHFSTRLSPKHSSRTRSSFVVASIFGGVALISSYLFWPGSPRSAPTFDNAPLLPTHFTPATVTSSTPCGNPNSRLITITVPPHSMPDINQTSFSPIWSIFIKDDDIQVERPYTPLEGIDRRGMMKFWIKKYPKGEVGRWIHSKSIGEVVEIRGPLKTWPWARDEWDDVVLISGGTGVAPFYQLLHQELFSRPPGSSKTRFTLLHSSRSPGELPPSEILGPIMSYANSHPSRLKVSIHVDVLDDSIVTTPVSLRVGRIGRRDIETAVGSGVDTSWWQRLYWGASLTGTRKPTTGKVLFLVCGPEPMIAALAGSFGRNMSQGPVGGVLGDMGYKSNQVWKL